MMIRGWPDRSANTTPQIAVETSISLTPIHLSVLSPARKHNQILYPKQATNPKLSDQCLQKKPDFHMRSFTITCPNLLTFNYHVPPCLFELFTSSFSCVAVSPSGEPQLIVFINTILPFIYPWDLYITPSRSLLRGAQVLRDAKYVLKEEAVEEEEQSLKPDWYSSILTTTQCAKLHTG